VWAALGFSSMRMDFFPLKYNKKCQLICILIFRFPLGNNYERNVAVVQRFFSTIATLSHTKYKLLTCQ
jgi:hypothetical protein